MSAIESTEVEVWKPVVGLEAFYEVSSHGRVRRSTQYRNCGRDALSQWAVESGHRQVVMSMHGKKHRRLVHRLVLESFDGPCPDGMECRHMDGDPSNNHKSNLEWGTPTENAQDKRRHGTYIQGEKSHYAKLTDVDVLAIRDIKSHLGWSNRRIAREFNISHDMIGLIVKRKNWTHI